MRLHILMLLIPLFGGFIFADDNLDESMAIEKIELLGGKVTRDEMLPGSPVVVVDLRGSQRFNDKHLHLLNSFKKLNSLHLEGVAVTDDWLKGISEQTHLTEVWIHGTQITYEGLDRLTNSLPHTHVYYQWSKDEATAAEEIFGLGEFEIDRTLLGWPVVVGGHLLGHLRRFSARTR